MKDQFFNDKPFMTLFKMYKGNYGKLFLSMVFFIIKHSPVWVMPIVTAQIINILTSQEGLDMRRLIFYIVTLIALVLMNIPANVVYIHYISSATRQVESDLRMNLVKKLQILSISYHKHLQAGRLQAKVLRDVEAITTLSRQFCSSIMPIIINLTVTFVLVIGRNKTVALFFLACLPISTFIVRGFRKNIRQSNRKLRKDIEDMSATVAQMVEMVPITRAHALEDIEIQKVDDKVGEVKKSGHRVDLLNAFFGASAWAIFQVLQVVCLLFTSYLAMSGEIEIGDIILYQSYFATILNQVSSSINIYPEIVKGFESINSVGEIFLAEDIEVHKGKKKVKKVKGSYTFNNVSFKYDDGEELVLQDFNLEVKPGESIAFVGESGGGKTTLLNLIIGFMKASQGEILLDGQNMDTLDLKSYRKHIAVVPQSTILFSGSIRDNITYGSEVSNEKLDEIIEAACLKEVIEKLPHGLDTEVGEHGAMLSGGQRQRIAIARALVRDPKVIILDEATSALDNQSEIHVQRAMKNLSKNRTTFIVAHRLSTILDADRIIVVSGGKYIEGGSYEELIEKQGEFYHLIHSRAI
jgi:ATP-binding cassette subfamily B protein